MATIKAPRWLRKPGSGRDEEEQEAVEGGGAESGVADVLTLLNVEAETELPENIKTSGQLASAQFRISRPTGYLYTDVDAAFEEAVNTVKYYEQIIYRRDLDIHKLATEVDRKNTDLTNMQFQLEAYRTKGKVVVGDDGNPIVVTGEVEVKDYDELQRKYETLQSTYDQLEQWATQVQPYIEKLEKNQRQENATVPLPTTPVQPNSAENSAESERLAQENAELQARIDELLAQISGLQAAGSSTAQAAGAPLGDEERQQLEALKTWASEVQVEYSRMEQTLEEANSSYEELSVQVQSLTSEVERLQSENESLTAEVTRLTQENESLTAEVQRVSGENVSLNQGLTTLTEENTTLAAELERASSADSAAAQELQDLTSAHAALSQDVERLTAENTTLTQEVTRLSGENESLSQSVEQLTADNTALHENIAQKDAYVDELTAWAEEIERQAQGYVSSVDDSVLDTPVDADAVSAMPDEQDYVEEQEEEVAPATYEEAPAQEEPYAEPAPQGGAEDDEDDFLRGLNDITSPEVPGATRKRPVRRNSGYKPVKPGDPLSSLPPGARLEDYL